jgi:hypothetical protein
MFKIMRDEDLKVLPVETAVLWEVSLRGVDVTTL